MRLGPVSLLERKVIGAVDGRPPLLVRYVLFRCASLGVYVHQLCRSDYDRALHDHPWPFVSIVLGTGYHEEHDQTIDGGTVLVWHPPGSVLLRPAEWRHRVVIGDRPAWTLVLVGRRQRRWGFWLPTGWCWWRTHNTALNLCEDQVLWPGGSD
jgi:hypothetical protein